MIKKLLPVMLAFLSGCATASSQSMEYDGAGPLPKPDKILVYDFAYAPDGVSPESAAAAGLYEMPTSSDLTPKDQQLGAAAAQELSEQIVHGLTELGFDTERVTGQPAIAGATSVVEIEGQFLKVHKGEAVARIVIGLGVGKSIVDTQVQIYDASRSGKVLVRQFTTHSRSSLKPGVLESVLGGPVTVGISAGVGTGLQLNETVVADSRRTANLIVSNLAALAYQRGWVTKEAAKQAHAKLDDA